MGNGRGSALGLDGARLQRIEQRADDGIGLCGQQHVDGGQGLIVHAPAAVQAMIERGMDDLGGRAGRAEHRLDRATQIDPVEAEDDVGPLAAPR